MGQVTSNLFFTYQLYYTYYITGEIISQFVGYYFFLQIV